MERRAHRGMRFGAKRFERMDANQDGRVSLAEATTLRLQRFDRIDADRGGTIRSKERSAALQARRGYAVTAARGEGGVGAGVPGEPSRKERMCQYVMRSGCG